MKIHSNPLTDQIAKSCLVLIFGCLLAGCGEQTANQWPDNSKDFRRIVAKRGMARVWDVIIDVENVPDGAIQYSDEGTYGTEPGTADVMARLEIGDVTVQLKAVTGKENFELTVNSKTMGNVRPGNRVRIAPDRTVLVNEKLREPT